METSNEDILKYNQHDLSKIAAVGNEKQKEWLRRFLETCDDTAEKQSLQKALEGARP
jgi:truncated hemoglobin YjbI